MTENLLTYAEAMAFLAGRIDYERAAADRLTAHGLKPDRMQALLALLGDPQESIPAVHIAGTKGKGSTAVMTAEILSAAGYRTGLFTSPHVSRFEERMRIDGTSPSPRECAELLNEILPAVAALDRLGPALQPTYFELATAMAWQCFRKGACDLVVLEVGLGGRLDATNLCRPLLSVITNVSRDHTHLLGETPREIAAEKAGIIKPHVPLLSGVLHPDAREVIHRTARNREADLYELQQDIRYSRRRSPLPPETSPGGVLPACVDVHTPWEFMRASGFRWPVRIRRPTRHWPSRPSICSRSAVITFRKTPSTREWPACAGPCGWKSCDPLRWWWSTRLIMKPRRRRCAPRSRTNSTRSARR